MDRVPLVCSNPNCGQFILPNDDAVIFKIPGLLLLYAFFHRNLNGQNCYNLWQKSKKEARDG